MNHEVIIGYIGLIITITVGFWKVIKMLDSFITRAEAYDNFMTRNECRTRHEIEELRNKMNKPQINKRGKK